MKNNLLISCTCAEDNFQKYFDRIQFWYNQLKTITYADFAVFVDGKVTPPTELSSKINFINLTPKLGRKTNNNFPGWKRSFREALKLANSEYDYYVHIENDVYIQNLKKIESYFKQPGYYMSYSNKYHFPESNLMILNDKQQNQKLIDFYSIETNLHENITFEQQLRRLIKYNTVFTSDRIEGERFRIKPEYDFLAQYF